MANYDHTKKWFITITSDFLHSPAFEQLRKQGNEYGMMYIDLIDLTKNSNGVFEYQVGSTIVPIDLPELLRKLVFFNAEQIKKGMEYMAAYGLLSYSENGVLRINNIEDFVGLKTIGAIKKEKQRRKKELMLRGGDYSEVVDNG